MWRNTRGLGALAQLHRGHVHDWRSLNCARAQAKDVGRRRNAKLEEEEALKLVRRLGFSRLRGGVLCFYFGLKNASAPREVLIDLYG